MKYLGFEKALRLYSVFSIKDVEKCFPDFDNRRLVEWKEKGYILKVRRGYYCFTERKTGEHFLFFSANKIYSPSYVSMESALAYYNLIPEGVFMTTSVTTKNTASYDTPIGDFNYKHVKPILFFGYRLINENDIVFKIADPEKVILDFFYFNKLNTVEEIEEMRFNEILMKELIDFEKLGKYQRRFNSKILDKRIKLFNKVIHA